MFHAKSQRWMTRAALFTVLVLGLVAWSPGITSTQVQLSQKKEPSPPAELKSPIISMMAASSIDAKGQIVNPTFTFPPNEPQITAIVYVGKINASQLRITWYKTSDDGDEKLFEHQIQVKSNDQAFSVCKNASGTLELGTYKVVATLEGQSEEIEFDVSQPKQQNKTSNNRVEKLFEDQAESKDGDRAFSITTNPRGSLTASTYESADNLEPQMRKIAWDASSNTARITTTAFTAPQSKRPVAGASGTAPQPASAPSVPTYGCDVKVYGGEIIRPRDFIADTVQIKSEAACQSASVVHVQATVRGVLQDVGSYPVAAGQSNSAVFNVDPCWLPGVSDLPGTEVSVQAIAEWFDQQKLQKVAKGVITLNHDLLAPRVKVVSTPARGTTVKAGDKINLKVTAQERRIRGPWQTGVKVVQVTAIPGGMVGGGWVNPSNLPKPCTEKTWEQEYGATYTVPNNPPPTIKICAIAEDYIGNESAQCGDFYANVMPPNCKLKGYAHSDLLDASPVLGAFDPASPNYNMISCNFRWTICAKSYLKTKVVKNSQGACKSFFDSEKANLPKDQFCCDCYPNCGAKPDRRRSH